MNLFLKLSRRRLFLKVTLVWSDGEESENRNENKIEKKWKNGAMHLLRY